MVGRVYGPIRDSSLGMVRPHTYRYSLEYELELGLSLFHESLGSDVRVVGGPSSKVICSFPLGKVNAIVSLIFAVTYFLFSFILITYY